MEWRLLHSLRYRFGEPVQLGPHLLRLGPVTSGCRQSLQIWPTPSLGYWREDGWGNRVYQAWFQQSTEELLIVSRLRLRPPSFNPFAFAVDERGLDSVPPEYRAVASELGDWLIPWRSFAGGAVALGVALNQSLGSIRYLAREEGGVQTPEQTLALGQGCCRDTAWLLVQALRQLGYPARLVSGYWLQRGVEVGELHAWAEMYLSGVGWLGLDPSAGLVVSHQHVILSRSPDPEGLGVLEGSHSGQSVPGEFRVRVRRAGQGRRTAPRESGLQIF